MTTDTKPRRRPCEAQVEARTADLAAQNDELKAQIEALQALLSATTKDLAAAHARLRHCPDPDLITVIYKTGRKP